MINRLKKFLDQSIKATNKVEGKYRLAIFKILKQFGRGRTCATFKKVNT